MNPQHPYNSLVERSREVALLGSVGSLLGWDQETHLPVAGGDYRAAQLSHLSALAHSRWVADEVGGWLDACEDGGGAAEPAAAANLREWRRSYDRARKLPQRLVEELSRQCSLGQQAWQKARADREFAQFAPHLWRIVELTREVREHVGYAVQPYGALLDEYEHGLDGATLSSLFETLAPRLAELARRGEERSRASPTRLPDGPYPQAGQAAFNREVATAFGFDFSAGRIDTSAHPFCTTLGARDTRMTTRYDERDFTNSLYCVLHETGHALYEQGLDPEAFGTPLGSASSLGVHESQSRLWENHVGRSPAFWERWLPRAASFFPQLAGITPGQLTEHVNRCRRSFIRVDADELTYDMHIILRFRIERAIVNDRLPVAEIPALWNQTFRELFDLEVPDDASGCLQDVHWSHGAFGYFPTYTLGNLNAAQLVQAARRSLPGLDDALARGDYAPLRDWLRESVHQHGQRHQPQALIKLASGAATAADAHLARLEALADAGGGAP